MFLARRFQIMVGAALICSAFVPQPALSQHAVKQSRPDKREIEVERVRQQVLAILRNENSCSAWFLEVDDDPAAVFESWHFEFEGRNPSYVFHLRDAHGEPLYKHPWSARTHQLGGRNSTVELNSTGPFFVSNAAIVELGPGGAPFRYEGFRRLTIASFAGNTPEGQITTLLHELGHVVGRIPEDDDSWNGRSSENTKEVLRHCKNEIRTYARKDLRSAN
jgi:hypothetical protein